MPRIAGVDLPPVKRMEVALTYIYGIGQARARKILEKTGVDPDLRAKDLPESDTAKRVRSANSKLEGVGRRSECSSITWLSCASRRRPMTEIPDLMAIRLQAQDVKVVDVSREGVLFECALRLMPGATSHVEFVRTDGPLRTRGRVVRSEIAAVFAGKVRYRVAIAFDQALDFVSDDDMPQASQFDMITTEVPAALLAGTAEFEAALSLNQW